MLNDLKKALYQHLKSMKLKDMTASEFEILVLLEDEFAI